jgi:hypothetical protein
LRGVDVAVDLIGDLTRGKPYGFVPQDNCSYTYFAIQFKGVNQKDLVIMLTAFHRPAKRLTMSLICVATQMKRC